MSIATSLHSSHEYVYRFRVLHLETLCIAQYLDSFNTNYIIFRNAEIFTKYFIFRNISFVKMESSNLIDYLTNMCGSGQAIIVLGFDCSYLFFKIWMHLLIGLFKMPYPI